MRKSRPQDAQDGVDQKLETIESRDNASRARAA